MLRCCRQRLQPNENGRALLPCVHLLLYNMRACVRPAGMCVCSQQLVSVATASTTIIIKSVCAQGAAERSASAWPQIARIRQQICVCVQERRTPARRRTRIQTHAQSSMCSEWKKREIGVIVVPRRYMRSFFSRSHVSMHMRISSLTN